MVYSVIIQSTWIVANEWNESWCLFDVDIWQTKNLVFQLLQWKRKTCGCSLHLLNVLESSTPITEPCCPWRPVIMPDLLALCWHDVLTNKQTNSSKQNFLIIEKMIKEVWRASTSGIRGLFQCVVNLLNIWEFVYFVCGLSPAKRHVVR